MNTLMLAPLEAALNTALRLDAQALQRLAELEGQSFQLIIEDWNLQFFLLPTSEGVLLRDSLPDSPSATISGTLPALCRVSLAKGSNAALFENPLHITGDLDAGEQLRAIFGELDLDWEEELSRWVGDVAAHKVGDIARQFKSSFDQARDTLGLNLKEFLQHELHALPTRSEVERFITEVTELRHHVDRVAARIDRLQPRGKHHAAS